MTEQSIHFLVRVQLDPAVPKHTGVRVDNIKTTIKEPGEDF